MWHADGGWLLLFPHYWHYSPSPIDHIPLSHGRGSCYCPASVTQCPLSSVQCPHCVWCPGAAITGLHIGNISRWSQTSSGIPGTRHCGYIIWKGWTGPTAEIFIEYLEIPTQSYIDLVGVVAVANCLKVNQEQQSPIKRTTLHGASCHCLFWADIEVPAHCFSFPCRVPVRHPAARLERVGHHTTNIQGE